MDLTVPADLLKLKARLEAWRATRKYACQPIPDEFRQAAAEMTERHPLSLVRCVLKLDPWRMKKPATRKFDRARHKPQTAFFALLICSNSGSVAPFFPSLSLLQFIDLSSER